MFDLFNETKNYYGKVIYADRYLYRHYGICTGYDSVIHFDGSSESTARIVETSLETFADGNIINICHRVSPTYSESEIVSRARFELGSKFGGYDLIDNNCEHFAIWCATGKKSSNQVFFKNDEKDVVDKALNIILEPGAIVCRKLDDIIEGTFGFLGKIFKENQARYYLDIE